MTIEELAPAVQALGRVEEVADAVFAYVQPDGGWCLNNAGIIVSGGECALVDTAATETRALGLKQAAARLCPAPPRIVVNTHFHGDHCFGNYLFAPEAVVVAHELCRTEMAEAGLQLTGLWPAVQWGAISLALPTLTFRDRLTLHVGDIEAQLLHSGPAHTTNDAVVWIPDRRVLFAGDLIMAGATPFVPMGSVSGSLETISRLRELGPAVVVPGHGPVGGPELLDAVEGYLRWVQRLAAEGHAAGVGPLDLARTADLGAYADWRDPERLVPNLRRAYAELDGAAPGDRLDMALVFGEMVQFHGGLPVCHA
ncbi:MAG TPA: MBL fold metallo-hydrolase [Actinocrinis sp.]|uniref:MBL fold metallo-hydrolase n=1 Tax=Actinocrinis sp. TaxID=1920516 RepID=UPI002DDD5FAE|nr:MBL fold metallo-hydrolase [Actinocrinis sp.]HEV3170721.1 MBL fold metallo-hydrolase [Actinocrinis sp.]